MHFVAQQLAEATRSRCAGGQLDSDTEKLARSSVNRAYYSCFLLTRSLLGRMDPTWSGIPHKNIPDLLREAVIKKIRKAKKGLVRAGVFKGDTSLAEGSAQNLATLLETAYGHRIVADYQPELPYILTHTSVMLPNGTSTLVSVMNWYGQANSHVKTIWRAADDLSI